MSSTEVLLLNALVYTITLVFFYIKYKMSAGVIIWLLYTVSAWSSYLFIKQPSYLSSIHASEQTLLPCIYLYFIFMIAMFPLMRLSKIEDIHFNNQRLLKWIIMGCTALQVIFVIVDIPAVISVLRSGSVMYKAIRSTVYSEGGAISLVSSIPMLNRLKNLYSGIRILATGLSVIVFIKIREDRFWINLFFVSCLLNNLRIIIVSVGRGEMVFVTLIYIISLYLIRDNLDRKAVRKMLSIGFPVAIIGAVFFWAITVSRFGNKAGFFMYKYMGEPINNFNGLLFNNIQGTTNGRAYFSVIYDWIGSGELMTTADKKWALIASSTGIRGDIFYTWVGGLIIEFGKIAPFIVAIVLNRAMARLASLENYFIGDLFVLVFFLNFYVRGIFLFPTQNLEGFLMIIFTVIFYMIFRIQRRDNGSIILTLPRIR